MTALGPKPPDKKDGRPTASPTDGKRDKRDKHSGEASPNQKIRQPSEKGRGELRPNPQNKSSSRSKVETGQKTPKKSKRQWPDLIVLSLVGGGMFWLGVASWKEPETAIPPGIVEAVWFLGWAEISCFILMGAGAGFFVGGAFLALRRYIADDTGRGFEKSMIGKCVGWVRGMPQRDPPKSRPSARLRGGVDQSPLDDARKKKSDR